MANLGYIEIQVGDAPPIQPRQGILTTPFAFPGLAERIPLGELIQQRKRIKQALQIERIQRFKRIA